MKILFYTLLFNSPTFSALGGDSLDYYEFKAGIEAFEALREELPDPSAVEHLIRSLFPDEDSEVKA